MENSNFEHKYLGKTTTERQSILEKLKAYKEEFLPDSIYLGRPENTNINGLISFAEQNLNSPILETTIKNNPVRKPRVMAERVQKYQYPEGMTSVEKRKYRAKMRREFKIIVTEVEG